VALGKAIGESIIDHLGISAATNLANSGGIPDATYKSLVA
jgi:hypothetical protein